jgi:hypothetical protein
MTACTQPGCTGTIVEDGYCDVCGSPASAPASVPAGVAASLASPSLATRPGPTKVHSGSESPSSTTDKRLRTACNQPGCTGTIVEDGYCDVCGSPAPAPAPVPAGAGVGVAAAVVASPTHADRPALTAVRRVVGVAAVLFLLSCAVVFYRIAPDVSASGSSPGTTATSSASPAPNKVGTQSATPGGRSSTANPPASEPGSAQQAVQVATLPRSAEPFQPVRIQGTYRGGADTFVRVQLWQAGKWVNFPLATKTDQSGRFTAYVEPGPPGRYLLRVVDADSGATSKPFVLVIKS